MIALSFGDKNIAMRGLALSLASIGALVSGCALNEQSADAQQIDIGMEGMLERYQLKCLLIK